MKIDNSKGWTEGVINENCSIDEFRKIAGILQSSFDISFKNKINDTDTFYWDFVHKDQELTLHFNIFLGVSFFPKSLTNATNAENQSVLDLYQQLIDILEKLNDINRYVSKFFYPEPIQWRLRGDQPLWRDMKVKTVRTNIPISSNDFEKLLYKLFKELTGELPQKGKNIYLKKYETIGLSNGVVCSDFWLDKGFSLLIQRYIESEKR
jgi:molybdenum cofactor cytidylyltransferase